MKKKTASTKTTSENRKKELFGCILTFILVFTFFKTVILFGFVPSESMKPTLDVSDLIIVNGFAYMKDEPRRGDIIIFKSPETAFRNKILIKRVIGIPGDDLMFIDGDIYLNGELLYETYLYSENPTTKVKTNSLKDFEVPEKCYFVLGDNRANSFDSRFWENPFVSRTAIKGRMLTHIPFSKAFAALF